MLAVDLGYLVLGHLDLGHLEVDFGLHHNILSASTLFLFFDLKIK